MRAFIHGFRRRQVQFRPRAGTILVITAIVLMALVGMLGLVLDAGQLMTAHRKTQNAADAAATAAAMDMIGGGSNGMATTTAVTFVQNYNGLPAATVVVNIPPASGPHAGNSRYVEVIVSNPFTVRFIQVVGISPTQTVTARAVAGREGVAVTAGVIALDRNARPGVNLTGNGTLKVNGTILVNSDGGGLAADGSPINNGNGGSAIVTSGNGNLHALDVQSVGGVSNISKIMNYDTSIAQSPLHTGTVIQSDPYQVLPPPTIANGAIATNYGDVKLSNAATVTLSPGVYTSLTLTSNANVVMNPGIYIILGGGLSMAGNSTLSGNGVMIYNTGSDYNVSTGLPDSGDVNSQPPAPGNPTFGGVEITGNTALNLTPYSNSASPFDGMVVYQRRLNPKPMKLAGNGTSDSLKGTVYAKWASLDLSGGGTFNAQFIVQRVDFSGNGTLVLDVEGQHLAQSELVFLVE